MRVNTLYLLLKQDIESQILYNDPAVLLTTISISSNVGTRNLLKNLSIESKNKKTWLRLKKLGEEIRLATDQETYEQIKNATWFDRELRAFELYNAEKNLCDELMHYPLQIG